VNKALSRNIQDVTGFESGSFNTWDSGLLGVEENETVFRRELSIILGLPLIMPISSFVVDLA
jgi:hypothetical protein